MVGSEGKALDNIDLSQVSLRYCKVTENGLFKKFIIKKVLLPQSHANIGAKSKIFHLRIPCEGQWREQNQAIHRGYLYFKSHTIHIQDI